MILTKEMMSLQKGATRLLAVICRCYIPPQNVLVYVQYFECTLRLTCPHFQRSRSYVTPPAGTFLDESGRGLPGSGTNVSVRPFQTSYRLPHSIQRAKKSSCWKASNGLVKVSRDSRLAWIITLNTFNSLIVREGTRFAVLHTPLLRILREMCFRQNISKTMPLHSFNLN